MADFRTLVNRALTECGASLDTIEAADFTSPSDSIQRKMKTWVGQAWREIQMEINDWQYMSKQAQLEIYPQFLITDGDRATAPGAGADFEGDDTDSTFNLLATPTLLSGAWATGTAVAIMKYSALSGQPKWGEYYDETSPGTQADCVRLKWWGRYNLSSLVSDLLEANTSTFFIQSTGGATLQTNTADADNGALTYVPWATWLQAYEGDATTRGRPLFFTQTPEGWYDFWPRPDEGYLLNFTYTAEPQELSAAADEPTGLDSQYQDLIVWRAVMYWADYQERPSQFARAERRYETIYNRLNRNQKPQFAFGPNVYSYGGN